MSVVVLPPPDVKPGQIKTLGPYGPKYEVIKPTRQLSDGDWELEILLVETSETAAYLYSQMTDDPVAD